MKKLKKKFGNLMFIKVAFWYNRNKWKGDFIIVKFISKIIKSVRKICEKSYELDNNISFSYSSYEENNSTINSYVGGNYSKKRRKNQNWKNIEIN